MPVLWTRTCIFFDATNPDAREYRVEQDARRTITTTGVQLFWLDEAEPEYNTYDFDNYRYYSRPGAARSATSIPQVYAQRLLRRA